MESKFKFKCPTSAEISASFLFKPKSDILDKVLVYYAFVTQTGSNMSQVCLVIWCYLFSPIIRKEEQDCTQNIFLLKNECSNVGLQITNHLKWIQIIFQGLNFYFMLPKLTWSYEIINSNSTTRKFPRR